MSDSCDGQVYLRADVKLEPLVNGWNAWSHLMSPAGQALNVAFRQIPILRSFVANPRVHTSALNDPTLFAGPYVNLKEADVPIVRGLLEQTLKRCERQIQFARDLLDSLRRLKGDVGFSLDHHYRDVPRSLAGMVEFTYDVSNQPHLRLIDQLVADELANSAREELAFTVQRDDARDFFLNTPRLETPERLIIELPFLDAGHDALSSLRITPAKFDDVAGMLRIPPDRRSRLETFFTSERPERASPAYSGDGIRVRCFGHACVLIQTPNTSVLIDPLFAFDRIDSEKHLTFHDLPDHVDYVFISHFHHDHFCPEHLLQLRGRVGQFLVPRHNSASIADPSVKSALESLGHHNIVVMEPFDEIAIPGNGRIVSLPFLGEHADLDIHSKHAMYLRVAGRAFMFVADSDCKDPMLYTRIARRLGKIDVLFVGMECEGAPLTWLYGPFLAGAVNRKDDESRRLSGSDSDRAWALVEACGCREVFVYAMGQDPWVKYLSGLDGKLGSKQLAESDRLLARCRAAGISAERLSGCLTLEY